MKYQELRRQMIDYIRQLPQSGWVVGTSGNMSVRAGDGMLITPSGVAYLEIKESDLFYVHADGTMEDGLGRPTSSLAFHRTIMKERPEVNVILHTHAPHAIGASAVSAHIPPLTLSVATRLGGGIPVSPYAENGSEQEAENILSALKHTYWAVLMQNHGAVSLGTDFNDAWLNMGYIEECCHAYLHCLSTGKAIHTIS